MILGEGAVVPLRLDRLIPAHRHRLIIEERVDGFGGAHRIEGVGILAEPGRNARQGDGPTHINSKGEQNHHRAHGPKGAPEERAHRDKLDERGDESEEDGAEHHAHAARAAVNDARERADAPLRVERRVEAEDVSEHLQLDPPRRRLRHGGEGYGASLRAHAGQSLANPAQYQGCARHRESIRTRAQCQRVHRRLEKQWNCNASRFRCDNEHEGAREPDAQ
mmetsp:Transcript_29584/g.96342  ORF Transcript_29584/g.96342 Transcript_29584/m.96342 type:complete len:221 (-) Transcript_29584:298-960(-)